LYKDYKMSARINRAKWKMVGGRPAIGTLAVLGTPLTAGILARAGYDFVLVDTQHGFWEMDQVAYAFRNIHLGDAVPVARVQKNDFYAIGALLDRGALGIVVPMVNTVEEAEAAAFAARCPPRGGRSAAGDVDGFLGSNYWEWIDDELFLAIQIETTEGLENVNEIMAVDGVDGCWIGPTDLARSMGVQLGDDAHEEAIRQVLEACLRNNKVPGIWAGEDAEARLEQGFRFVTASGDTTFVKNGAVETLARLQVFRRP
jgi:4-hydroxy-2-oxoheptanedioate aldolase